MRKRNRRWLGPVSTASPLGLSLGLPTPAGSLLPGPGGRWHDAEMPRPQEEPVGDSHGHSGSHPAAAPSLWRRARGVSCSGGKTLFPPGGQVSRGGAASCGLVSEVLSGLPGPSPSLQGVGTLVRPGLPMAPDPWREQGTQQAARAAWPLKGSLRLEPGHGVVSCRGSSLVLGSRGHPFSWPSPSVFLPVKSGIPQGLGACGKPCPPGPGQGPRARAQCIELPLIWGTTEPSCLQTQTERDSEMGQSWGWWLSSHRSALPLLPPGSVNIHPSSTIIRP